MGKVLQLAKYRSAEQRQVVAQRGYSRFLARQYQRRQVAEKRKRQDALQGEQTDQ